MNNRKGKNRIATKLTAVLLSAVLILSCLGVPDQTACADELEVKGTVQLYKWTRVDNLNELPRDRNLFTVMLLWTSGVNKFDVSENRFKGVTYYSDKLKYYYYEGEDYKGDDVLYTYLYNAPSENSNYLVIPGNQSFYSKTNLSSIQIQYLDDDKDNYYTARNLGYGTYWYCPKYAIKVNNQYLFAWYLKTHISLVDSYETSLGGLIRQCDWTIQGDEGRYKIFCNLKGAVDNYLQTSGNQISSNREANAGDFMIYIRSTENFSAIEKDYTVKAGQILTIEESVYIKDDVTLTIEDGGILSVKGQLFNDGKILNKGTMMVNENACVCPFEPTSTFGGEITCDGGDIIIMENAKLLAGNGSCRLKLQNGATCVNYGYLIGAGTLEMDNSLIENKKTGHIYINYQLGKHPDYMKNASSVSEVEKYLTKGRNNYTLTMKNNSKIVNRGALNVTEKEKFVNEDCSIIE